MKYKLYFSICLLFSGIVLQAQTITFTGCPQLFDNNTFTFNKVGTDATGRHIYETTPINGDQPCSGLGTCEFRIAWNAAQNRWEFLADEGNGTFTTPYLIYSNATASKPNPPDLTLGVWTENISITENFCGGNLTPANATLTGGVQSSATLPVKLISFSGKYQNGMAILQWQSGVENNFAHYEVEKSTDAVAFIKVGTVSAKGNNSQYNLSLMQPEANAWYRLKMNDNNGSFVYSEVKQVTGNTDAQAGLKVYPNPVVNGTMYIETQVDSKGYIYNTSGSLVKTIDLRKGRNMVSVSGIASGVYFIKTSTHEQARILVK